MPRAGSGWALVIPLMVAGAGLGLLVSQLNNYTLSPIAEERVAEAAGVNSAAGSFGLSFGLAFGGAIMLATLSIAFTQMAQDSKVLTPAQQTQVSDALEHDAEVMSNTALVEQLAGQPPAVKEEIVSINTDARPLALQVALARAAAGGAARAVQRVPDDAPARPEAVGQRGTGTRLSATRAPGGVLAAACVSALVVNANTSAVTILLPSISKDVGAPVAQLQWAVTGYSLVGAAVIVTSGALGDVFGRRKVFLGGLALFVASCALIALSTRRRRRRRRADDPGRGRRDDPGLRHEPAVGRRVRRRRR